MMQDVQKSAVKHGKTKKNESCREKPWEILETTGNLVPPSNIETWRQFGDNVAMAAFCCNLLKEEMQIEELNPEPMCCTQGPMFTAGSGPRGSINIRLGFGYIRLDCGTSWVY